MKGQPESNPMAGLISEISTLKRCSKPGEVPDLMFGSAEDKEAFEKMCLDYYLESKRQKGQGQ